jgi:hypothetical protein
VLIHSLRCDSGRLGRLEREAQVLASLNHPHIAQIYGFEDSFDVPAPPGGTSARWRRAAMARSFSTS